MTDSLNSYNIYQSFDVGELGVNNIKRYLQFQFFTERVTDVQKDPMFMKSDIDLIWATHLLGEHRYHHIEVKTDEKAHLTGNYFFETISNLERKTPGCFLYTKADFIFYYLIRINQLHIFKVVPAREWFLYNFNSFVDRDVRTNELYTTRGKLVDISLFKKNIHVGIVDNV